MAITVGDKTYRNLPEQVEENANNIEELKFLISQLGTAMTYKGSVATYADLPTENNKIGDVWNVIDTGSNYAWTGEEWDEFGSAIDTSNLVDLDSAQTITGTKTFDDLHISYKNNYKTNSIKFDGAYSTPEIYVDLYDLNVNVPLRVGGKLYPSTNASLDIGTSDYKWKDLYLSGTAYVYGKVKLSNSSNVGYQLGNRGDGYLSIFNNNGNIVYDFDNLGLINRSGQDLGSNSYKWKDLYLSGTAYLSNNTVASVEIDFTNQYSTGTIKYSGYQFLFSGAITSGAINPNGNNVRDLGSSGTRWKDLYLGGNLSDGINSVSVANLAWKEYDIVNNTVSVSASVIVSGTFFENSISITGAGFPAGTKEVLVELSNGSIYSANSIYSATSFYINSTVNMQSMTPKITKIYYR